MKAPQKTLEERKKEREDRIATIEARIAEAQAARERDVAARLEEAKKRREAVMATRMTPGLAERLGQAPVFVREAQNQPQPQPQPPQQKRRALIIAVGFPEDAKKASAFYVDLGCKEMRVLSTAGETTRAGIEAGLKWLAETAAEDEIVFLFCSGTAGKQGIMPSDHETAGAIPTAAIAETLRAKKTAGVRVIFDGHADWASFDLRHNITVVHGVKAEVPPVFLTEAAAADTRAEVLAKMREQLERARPAPAPELMEWSAGGPKVPRASQASTSATTFPTFCALSGSAAGIIDTLRRYVRVLPHTVISTWPKGEWLVRQAPLAFSSDTPILPGDVFNL